MISSINSKTLLSDLKTLQENSSVPVGLTQTVDKIPQISDLPPVQDIKIDSNFAATTSMQMPMTPENDVPADVSALTLGMLPAARDVMLNKVQNVSASTFAVACVETLMASQPTAGESASACQTAVNNYIQSIQDPQLKQALSNFVTQHKNTPASAEVDGNGNFSPALLAAAQQAYPSTPAPAVSPAVVPTPAMTPKPAVTPKPAATPTPAVTPPVAAKPHSQPVDGKAPSAAPSQSPPTVAGKPSAAAPPANLTALQALQQVNAFASKAPLAGHDLTADVAAVLGYDKAEVGNVTDSNFNFNSKSASTQKVNNNPSVAQYASVMYLLGQVSNKASPQYNPALANFITTTLDQEHPAPSKNVASLSASMQQQIQVANIAAGYDSSKGAPTAAQQSAIEAALQRNMPFTFANAGFSANIPNMTLASNVNNADQVRANTAAHLNLPTGPIFINRVNGKEVYNFSPGTLPVPPAPPKAPKPPAAPPAPTPAQQALSSVANIPAGSRPAGHNYPLDVAAVLKEQDGSASLNTNPSATQFASFMYSLFLATTPATKQANPTLASYLSSTLDKVYPTHPTPGSVGPPSLSASMLQQIQVAENVAGYNPASNVPPTAKQQQAIYTALQNNLVFTFAYAGLSANSIPNINMNPGNAAEVQANGKNGLVLPIADPNTPVSGGPVNGGK